MQMLSCTFGAMYFESAFRVNHAWQSYLVTAVLTILGIILGNFPITIALWFNGDLVDTTRSTAQIMQETSLDSNLILAFSLLPFITGLAAFFLAYRTFHYPKFNILWNAILSIRWNRVFMAFLVWTVMIFLSEIVNYFVEPSAYSYHAPKLSYMLLLLVCFTLIPLQVAFEELIFRAYFMQGFCYSMKSKWISLFIASLLFALMHLANPEVVAYGVGTMFAYYMISGLMLGIFLIVGDGLELAFGVHVATNIYASCIMSYEHAALNTDALFRVRTIDPASGSLGLIILAAIFLLFMHYLYKLNWNFSLNEDEVKRNLDLKNQIEIS